MLRADCLARIARRIYVVASWSRSRKATERGAADLARETAMERDAATTIDRASAASRIEPTAIDARRIAVAIAADGTLLMVGDVTSGIAILLTTVIAIGAIELGAATAIRGAITATGRVAGGMAIALWLHIEFAIIGEIGIAMITRSAAVGTMANGMDIADGIVGTTGVTGRVSTDALISGGDGPRRLALPRG